MDQSERKDAEDLERLPEWASSNTSSLRGFTGGASCVEDNDGRSQDGHTPERKHTLYF